MDIANRIASEATTPTVPARPELRLRSPVGDQASAVRRTHQTPYLRIATARAGNVIGGGDWAADRIVPDAIRSLARGEQIPVRNPAATRPWQHVIEPLSGYLRLAEALPRIPILLVRLSISAPACLVIALWVIWWPRSSSTGLENGWTIVIQPLFMRPTCCICKLIRPITDWAGSPVGITPPHWPAPWAGIAIITRQIRTRVLPGGSKRLRLTPFVSLMSDPQDLKQEILRLTREYSRQVHASFRPASDPERQPWKKGTTIPYAGRVFAEDEVEAAVSSTLDFWLTLGSEGSRNGEGAGRLHGGAPLAAGEFRLQRQSGGYLCPHLHQAAGGTAYQAR